MKVVLSWLNEYVKCDDFSIDYISDKLLNVGFETESVTYLGEGISGVVAAKIVSIEKHPNADKLQICAVKIDENTTVQIVTGAPNVKAGDIVPAALDGAILPGGKKIIATDFRGVESHGMLCGGSELGVTDDVLEGAEFDGLLQLPPDTKIGEDIKSVLGLDDYVLDIGITANRGDCQSVYGICRELAAALKRELKPLNLSYKTYPYVSAPNTSCAANKNCNPDSNLADFIGIEIKDKSLCSKYMGSRITDVKIQKSPQWLRRRLHFLGMNSKNNIVDITNYVLLEVGQPLHAFDKNVIEGGIIVRRALTDEKIKALDGQNYTLKDSMLVIADHKKPLAIAGIMGGEFSGTYDTTKEVFLESARFARGSIRLSSRSLGLRSDSSLRFERGVDAGSPDTGRRRALSLIDELGAGKVMDVLCKDEAASDPQKTIEFEYRRFKDILGISIPKGFTKDILQRLGFGVNEGGNCGKGSIAEKGKNSVNGKAGNTIKVTVPDFREDIDNFTDIVEEVVRFYGYDKLGEGKLVTTQSQGGIPKRRENINAIEGICCGAGAFEINNYSFIPARHFDMLCLPDDSPIKRAIRIQNPLSEDYAYLRTQLVSGMLETVRRNQSRGNNNFALFEIDNIFIPHSLPLEKLPTESLTLCMGFSGGGWDFYKIKALVTVLLDTFKLSYEFRRSTAPFLHPGKSADILINGVMNGCFGEVHPSVGENFSLSGEVFVFGLTLEGFIDNEISAVKVAPLPKFPFVERDLAVVVSEDTQAGSIISLIKSADSLVKNVTLFDIYRGSQIEEGCKSLALKIVLQNPEKTMTDGEITGVINKTIDILRDAGVRLRE